MSFVITYAESSFTALGSNSVRRDALRKAIAAQPAITDVLEAIRPSNYGAGSAESATATGRTWGFQFAGSGPSMAGSGQAALDAIVAAHTGVHVEADSPAVGGLEGKVWGWSSGIPGWVTPAAGSGDVTGQAGGTVDTELALFSSTTGKALKGSGNFTLDLTTGRFAAPAGMTAPGIVSGGTNKLVFGITSAGVQDSTPVAAITSAIGGGTNGATVNLHAGSRNPDGNVSAFSGFYFASAGTSSGFFFKNNGATDTTWREAMHVAAVSAPRRIVATKNGTLQSDAPFLAVMKRYMSGLVMAYTSGAPDSFTVDVGECMDETGVYPMLVTSIKTVTCAVGNLDTGALAAATIYYVWLFGKSAGAESDTTVRFSLSPSAPTSPSGFDIRRRIGSVRTNSTTTTFVPFVQTGTNEVRRYLFRQDTTAAPCAAIAAGASNVFATLSVPVPKTATCIYLQVTCGVASMTTSLVDSAQAANITAGTARVAVGASGSGTQAQVVLPLIPALSTGAATPQYKVSTSGSTTINVSGYEESL